VTYDPREKNLQTDLTKIRFITYKTEECIAQI